MVSSSDIMMFDLCIQRRIRTLNNLINKAHSEINNFNIIKEAFDNDINYNEYNKLVEQKNKNKYLLNLININYTKVKYYIGDELYQKVILYMNELKYGIDYLPKIEKLCCPLCRYYNNYATTIINANDMCSICIQEDNNKKCIMSECKHIYHVECIQKYRTYKQIRFMIRS